LSCAQAFAHYSDEIDDSVNDSADARRISSALLVLYKQQGLSEATRTRRYELGIESCCCSLEGNLVTRSLRLALCAKRKKTLLLLGAAKQDSYAAEFSHI